MWNINPLLLIAISIAFTCSKFDVYLFDCNGHVIIKTTLNCKKITKY